jgi:DNA repair protein RecO (recombination protein O)
MVTDTDGIILKQTKLPGDRRMLVMLTRRFGKISAGTGIKLNGRNKSALAIRVFTHGKYEIFHGRESFNINAAETIESYYGIGEDVDKYMYASYVLEFTEKILHEEQPAEDVLDLLLDFMKLLEIRKSKLKSLVVMYQWKLIALCGYMPSLKGCSHCNRRDVETVGLSIVDGGLVCEDCINSGTVNLRLLYSTKYDIIRILEFIRVNDMKSLGRLALKDDVSSYLFEILKEYVSYHLDINNLKSESYLNI